MEAKHGHRFQIYISHVKREHSKNWQKTQTGYSWMLSSAVSIISLFEDLCLCLKKTGIISTEVLFKYHICPTEQKIYNFGAYMIFTDFWKLVKSYRHSRLC